jgi:hypothetical protein
MIMRNESIAKRSLSSAEFQVHEAVRNNEINYQASDELRDMLFQTSLAFYRGNYDSVRKHCIDINYRLFAARSAK